MRLLNCIVSHNRYYYLANLVGSLREFFKVGDILIVDTGSRDPRLVKYLDNLKYEGIQVIRLNVYELNHAVYGGLYSAMNQGIEIALANDYDYINFLQDDTQFMWHDPGLFEKVMTIFDRFDDAVQVSYHFFKRIIVSQIEDHIEVYRQQRCYHLSPYTVSDLGIVPLAFIQKYKFSVFGTEDDRNASLYPKGFKRYSLATPVLAWVPWPATTRADATYGKLKPPREKYYLKPLDTVQVGQLMSRAVEDLPCHEDYCFPWNWRCLTPYWFTTPNWRKYIFCLWHSWKQGRPIVPYFVCM